MKISWQWLKQFVIAPVSVEEAAERLTLLGLEEDGIKPVSVNFSQVVIGQIVDVAPHPQADRLQLCQVEVGNSEPLEIVCGAANARAGIKVACALVGANLGGIQIKQVKMRGVVSSGMLCSEQELGLSTASSGIMELPGDAPIGALVYDYMQLDDVVIDIDLTPNRGDCFSVLGVARELAAFYKMPLISPSNCSNHTSALEHVPVIEAQDGCGRFATCVVEGIDTAAQTPLWMVESLRRAGVRSLHPVVDVTNYVMLALGQPLHAYDASTLRGALTARWGCGDRFELIDGRTIEADEEVLVIADDSGALGLAGIMGGAASAVQQHSQCVVLEAAWFHPDAIAGRARRYGLHTEASLRFERGVDYALPQYALEYAAALITEITGGTAGRIVQVDAPSTLPDRGAVALPLSALGADLGIEGIPAGLDVWFEASGFTVKKTADYWMLTPPSWRFDICIPEDLVEEVARFYGYDQLPHQYSGSTLRIQAAPEKYRSRDAVALQLAHQGYQEVITYSFIEGDIQQKWFPEQQGIALENPISQDMNVMRVSLLPGLVQTVVFNQNRQQKRIAIFEQGLRFSAQGTGFDNIAQIPTLAIGYFGLCAPSHWQLKQDQADYYTVKGAIENLLPRRVEWKSDAQQQWAHPYRSARIVLDDVVVGYIGELHPELMDKLGLALPGAVAELNMEAVLEVGLPHFETFSVLPIITRDTSFIVEKSIEFSDLLSHINKKQLEWLSKVCILDVYEGSGVPEGMKSVTLHFVWQAVEKTPTDEQIDDKMQQAIQILQAAYPTIELRR